MNRPRNRAVFFIAVGLSILSASCYRRAARVESERRAAVAAVTPAEPAAPRRDPEAISLLGRPLYATPATSDPTRLESDLADARAALAADDSDPRNWIWVGRRLGYLWRMREAIDVYTRAIERFPEYAPLYRHRGHRYISVREFDQAIVDLERATQLILGKPDEIEPDGAPNARNIPLTTTGFNVWYHLGVARFLKGDYSGAAKAFEETLQYTGGRDDNLVAVSDWLYITLRRLGRHDEAFRLLSPIRPDMNIIENGAYHRRLLMYKGLIDSRDVLDLRDGSALDFATLGYGVGYWLMHTGQIASGLNVFERVVAGPYWPAFGYIASEVELARERARHDRTRFRPNK